MRSRGVYEIRFCSEGDRGGGDTVFPTQDAVLFERIMLTSWWQEDESEGRSWNSFIGQPERKATVRGERAFDMYMHVAGMVCDHAAKHKQTMLERNFAVPRQGCGVGIKQTIDRSRPDRIFFTWTGVKHNLDLDLDRDSCLAEYGHTDSVGSTRVVAVHVSKDVKNAKCTYRS